MWTMRAGSIPGRSAARPTRRGWLDTVVSDQVIGTWTDPKLAGQTFGTLAERWMATKATGAPKTVAGYRSLLDVSVPAGTYNVGLCAINPGTGPVNKNGNTIGLVTVTP